MKRMIRASLALAVGGVMALAAQPAAAQLSDPAAYAKGYKAPRNSYGQPDLSGTWSNATITPFERDPKLGARRVLTDAEVKAAEGATAALNADGAKPTDPNVKVTDLPYECGRGFKGVDCGYNNFWVDPGTKILRLNGEPRASVLVEPANGRLPPMKPEALARMRSRIGTAQNGNFDGPERRPLAERCIVAFGSSSGPPMMPVLYNNHYQFMQSADEVLMVIEMVHDARIVRLNGKHAPGSLKTWMGDSIGRWEGETLVVETINQRPEQSFRGASPNARVTERFTRISPQQILYQFEVDDPTAFEAPFKGELALNNTQDQVYEYACHEGNYALPGILAGARAEEKAGREMEGNRGEVKEEGQ